jgi:DNA-binding CsgD family transcriptional regulator
MSTGPVEYLVVAFPDGNVSDEIAAELAGLVTTKVNRDDAASRRLLVTVGDVPWLDNATVEVLGFVARRRRTTPGQGSPAAGQQPFEAHRSAVASPEGDQTAGPRGVPATSELLALAWRGSEAETRAAAAAWAHDRARVGLGIPAALAHYALTVLELGLGRYAPALTYALEVYRDDPPELGTEVLPDLIEAASRCGDGEAARLALQRLSERTDRGSAPLADGLLTRSRALLATDDAEDLHRSAVEHLRQSGARAHLARAQLVYGEWLRRQRRRRDAREQLRAAFQLFDDLGFAAFARRAEIELCATAEHVGKRSEVHDRLTAQEAQITRLVVEGASNRQVAAQLFISQNTVEYHLQKVFRKIGVRSRTQLARVMLDRTSGEYPADSLIDRPSSAPKELR